MVYTTKEEHQLKNTEQNSKINTIKNKYYFIKSNIKKVSLINT